MLDFNQDSAKTVVRRKYEDSMGKTRLDRVKSVFPQTMVFIVRLSSYPMTP